MADDKAKKDAKPPITLKVMIEEMIVLGIGIYIVMRLLGGYGDVEGGTLAQRFQAMIDGVGATPIIHNFVVAYFIFANILTILFVVGITYALLRVQTYLRESREKLYPHGADVIEEVVKNPRWQRVLTHISSDNPNDWRLAILECDIMLDEVLDKEGYVGDTIGDKLKKAVRGDFKTLDEAWEAHRIRNAIAHEGQDFAVTDREARRVINLYETVFKEFDFI